VLGGLLRNKFGEIEGCALGRLVGTSLRDSMGVPDGFALGASLEDTLGEVLVDALGRFDGDSLGDSEDTDGALLGESLG